VKSSRALGQEPGRQVGLGRCSPPIVALALAGTFAACSSQSSVDTSNHAHQIQGPGAAFVGPEGTFVDDAGPAGFGAPRMGPTFGPTTIATSPPPPISGGTLLATRDGAHAVAADPERDSVYVVDLKTQAVTTIALAAGDEPGRVVEDGAGRVHVVLRSGGALATIDTSNGSLLARRDVCSAPRGVAWDAATDLVWVVCATGELVALPAAGGPAAHSFTIERDLRDVIVGQGSLAVTKFRSAEVLRIASNGTVTRRDPLPSPDGSFAAHVAWRTVAGPSGTVVTVHQAESVSSVVTTVQGGYGGGGACGQGPAFLPPGPPPLDDAGLPVAIPVPVFDAGPVVTPTEAGSIVTSTDAATQGPLDAGVQGSDALDAAVSSLPLPPPPPPPGSPRCLDSSAASGATPRAFFSSALPPCGSSGTSGIVLGVLTALGPDGSVVLNLPFPGVLPLDVAVSPDGSAVAAVAPGNAFTKGLDTVFVFSACGVHRESTPIGTATETSVQPIAVAFDGPDHLLVQTREPAQLRIYEAGGPVVIVPLSSVSREDTGHDIFHTQAGAMIACASCHPEGRDDGHVWILDNNRRRTPSLQGTIAGTAPYHWPGDEANLTVLANDVYTVRMNGAALPKDQMGALTRWVQTVPAPPAPASSRSSASTRGKALFERPDIGCSKCHSGPKFTNNQTVDVGTGGAFQVPPLVGVGWRTPLMHDGCAATLADRFGACSTAEHGSTGSLSPGEIADLVAYLETL
jgi:hypothetical protein